MNTWNPTELSGDGESEKDLSYGEGLFLSLNRTKYTEIVKSSASTVFF